MGALLKFFHVSDSFRSFSSQFSDNMEFLSTLPQSFNVLLLKIYFVIKSNFLFQRGDLDGFREGIGNLKGKVRVFRTNLANADALRQIQKVF